MKTIQKLMLGAVLLNMHAFANDLPEANTSSFQTQSMQTQSIQQKEEASSVEALFKMVEATKIEDIKQVKDQAHEVISKLAPVTTDDLQIAMTDFTNGLYHSGKGIVGFAKAAGQIIPPAALAFSALMAGNIGTAITAGDLVVKNIQQNMDGIISAQKSFVKGLEELGSSASHFWNFATSAVAKAIF